MNSRFVQSESGDESALCSRSSGSRMVGWLVWSLYTGSRPAVPNRHLDKCRRPSTTRRVRCNYQPYVPEPGAPLIILLRSSDKMASKTQRNGRAAQGSPERFRRTRVAGPEPAHGRAVEGFFGDLRVSGCGYVVSAAQERRPPRGG
jgi:hypothetical protein